MVRRTIIFVFLLLIGVFLFVSLILDTGVDAIGETLSQFRLVNFLILLALSLLNFGLFTWRWAIIIKHHTKKKFSFFRLYLHRMSAYAVSYLTPVSTSGGEPVRIFFLTEDGIKTKTAISTVVIDKVFEYTALILFILSGVVISVIEGSIFPGKTELMLAFFILLFGGIIFWFYYSTIKNIGFFSSIFKFFRLNKFKKIKKMDKSIRNVEDMMSNFYKDNLPKFIFLLLLSFSMVFFMVFEHYIIALFMGFKLTFLQAFLSATIPGIAYIIPIPGALGVLEGSHKGIFALLGIPINYFVFVLIIRLRDIIFILIGLGHASKHGIQMIYRSFKNGSSKLK